VSAGYDFSLGRLITTSASIASLHSRRWLKVSQQFVTLAVEITISKFNSQSRQIPFATAALALPKQGYPQKRLATGGCTIWATRPPVLRELLFAGTGTSEEIWFEQDAIAV